MARSRREPSAADLAPETPRRPEAKVFAEIAARSKSFRPARETLRRVRAVPTIFPDYDRKTRVGGHPVDRVTVVHGPSSHGKTVFTHGLGLSFLRRGHLYCPIDAEMTTPIDWVETLLGEHADNPAFLASRPKSYEQAVDDVRRVAEGVADARAKGKLPPETTCLFAVDSIRKLVPEDIQARIKKLGAEGEKGSVDGFSGAAGRMRAAMNAAWLDELVPLMYHTGCAILFVGREADDPNADARDRQFGNDWKLTGGRGLYFDSSLVVRISRDAYVWEGEGEAETKKVAIGERHRVEIHKTKVAAHQDKIDRAYFWTSNGLRAPEGFWRARDVLHVGKATGVVKAAGSWLSFDRKRWQGEERFLAGASAEVLDAIEAAARGKFAEDAAKRADVVGAEP